MGEKGARDVAYRRTLGVVAITKENGCQPQAPAVHYFRLKREFDRTGTFTLGGEVGISPTPQTVVPLRPETKYEVRIGTLTIDDPKPDDDSISNNELATRLPKPTIWWDELLTLSEEDSQANFTTFPDHACEQTQPISFIVGSCRYPGLLWQAGMILVWCEDESIVFGNSVVTGRRGFRAALGGCGAVRWVSETPRRAWE